MIDISLLWHHFEVGTVKVGPEGATRSLSGWSCHLRRYFPIPVDEATGSLPDNRWSRGTAPHHAKPNNGSMKYNDRNVATKPTTHMTAPIFIIAVSGMTPVPYTIAFVAVEIGRR